MIRLLAALCLLFAANAAAAQSVNGNDADACDGNHGSAVKATIIGLKDRVGRLKLELYPGNAADFLKDDRDLVREGKFFRRIWSPTPQSGPVILCIRAPKPGRYAILFTHDRDNQNKFNFWKDGAGFPANSKLGRSRPKVDQALITVGNGVANVTIRAQYLRGLGGFSPMDQ